MSWFWGGKDQQTDPTTDLDPDLKKFLEQQQPKPYEPTDFTTEPQQKPQPSKQPPDAGERPVPQESLFQDGRYAHLWKTYVPQSKTQETVDPITHVVKSRKDRNSSIQKAAYENCAFEQELQQKCLGLGVTGTIRAKMTACQEETKSFNRCYQLQGRFLQALGYLTTLNSTDEEEERIQMHADTLYHRMMGYEADVDSARRNGKPIPPLTSLFDPKKPAPSVEDIELPKQAIDKLKTPLAELPPHERELVARAAATEAQYGNEVAEEFFAVTGALNEQRKQRQASLIKLLGEPVGRFLIPDAPEHLTDNGKEASQQNLAGRAWQKAVSSSEKGTTPPKP